MLGVVVANSSIQLVSFCDFITLRMATFRWQRIEEILFINKSEMGRVGHRS